MNPDEIAIENEETGEIFYGPRGSAVPAGYRMVEEKAPPAKEYGPDPDKPSTLGEFIFGLERGGKRRGGLAEVAEAIPPIAGGAGAGYLAGKGVGKGAAWLSRFRLPGMGQAGDVERVGQAVAKASPALSSAEEGLGGLMSATRGPAGQAALSAERDAAESGFLAKARNIPGAGELLNQIKGLGAQGFAQKTGEIKDAASAAAARAARDEATTKMRQLLAGDPEALQAFEDMQGRFATGSEIRRTFRPGANDPFRAGDFNQRALQQRVLGRYGRLPQELQNAILRGGAPGLDQDVRIPLPFSLPSIPGGRVLSGPTGPVGRALNSPEWQRMIEALGATGGGAAGYGLSQMLSAE